jgi:hypothetical protein
VTRLYPVMGEHRHTMAHLEGFAPRHPAPATGALSLDESGLRPRRRAVHAADTHTCNVVPECSRVGHVLFLRPPRRGDAASGRGPPHLNSSSSDLIRSWFSQYRRWTRGLETAPGSCSSPSRARVQSDTIGAQTGHTVRPALFSPPLDGSGRRATRSARDR